MTLKKYFKAITLLMFCAIVFALSACSQKTGCPGAITSVNSVERPQ